MKSLAVAIAVALASPCFAKGPQCQLGDHLSREEMLQLQVDALQLDRIQKAAQEAARSFVLDREDVLKRHGLTQDLLTSGAARIEDDGTITRSKQQQPAADMGAPKKGK